MIIRYLSSAPIGIAATAALFYVMQVLIQLAPGQAPVAIERMPVTFVRDIRKEVIEIDDLPPPRIPPPVQIPEESRKLDGPDEHSLLGIGNPAPTPIETGLPGIDFGYSNGALVNIFKVAPTYPVAALRRNLEGYATVRFDVTESGAIENVTVIDSSDSVFHKAAIAAAYRFRYKPRVVDGVALATRRLVNRFVFKIENRAENM